jgi:hypothetical protein
MEAGGLSLGSQELLMDILRQLNPAHYFVTCFSNIHFSLSSRFVPSGFIDLFIKRRYPCLTLYNVE